LAVGVLLVVYGLPALPALSGLALGAAIVIALTLPAGAVVAGSYTTDVPLVALLGAAGCVIASLAGELAVPDVADVERRGSVVPGILLTCRPGASTSGRGRLVGDDILRGWGRNA
jgi:hypothetical protein